MQGTAMTDDILLKIKEIVDDDDYDYKEYERFEDIYELFYPPEQRKTVTQGISASAAASCSAVSFNGGKFFVEVPDESN